jgi:nicotinate-nucleotide pyrophosphorylase
LLASLAFGPQKTFLTAFVAAEIDGVISAHTVQRQAKERYGLDVQITQLGKDGVLVQVGDFVYVVYQNVNMLKTLNCCSHHFSEMDRTFDIGS